MQIQIKKTEKEQPNKNKELIKNITKGTMDSEINKEENRQRTPNKTIRHNPTTKQQTKPMSSHINQRSNK